jgi:HEAT repeat protein
MRKIITLIFVLIHFGLSAQEKTVSDFKKDFKKIVKSELTKEQLNKLFREYALILTPHSDVTQLFASLQGTNFNEYSMLDFKEDKLYKSNIDKLLHSKNPYNRILSYLLIASTNDKSKEEILLDKIKTETEKGNLIWSGMALLSLKSNHTDELFDFLVENETFGDAHMLPLYIQLDKNLLQQTAYRKINSENDIAKILAVQILSVTQNNPKTEELIKNAVKNWDMNMKGYAIYTLAELQIGNVLELLTPLLNDERTKRIALKALANSPTQEDREYLISAVTNKETVDEDVLDALFNSKNIENLKLWLSIMQTNEIAEDYYFFVFKQPLLANDEMLDDLQNAIKNIKDKNILHELVRALEGRADDKSVDLMITLLQHPSSTVRYWTAKTLENNSSPKLKMLENQELLKKGLADGNKRD